MIRYILDNKNTCHETMYIGVWFIFLGIVERISVSYSIDDRVFFSGKEAAIIAVTIGTGCIIRYFIKSHKPSLPHITINSSGIVISNDSDAKQKKKNKHRIPWENVSMIYLTDIKDSSSTENGPFLHIIRNDNSEIIFSLHDYKLGYNYYQMMRSIRVFSGRDDIIKQTCKHIWLVTLSNPFVNSIKK